MFSVEVRDRMMIAHSLPDPFFGPAQKLHGATYVVDVAFYRDQLTAQNVVVDIGAALAALANALKPLAYQNLDALPQFEDHLTTTEFLCKYVFDRIAEFRPNRRTRRGWKNPVAHPRHPFGNGYSARQLRGKHRWLKPSSPYLET